LDMQMKPKEHHRLKARRVKEEFFYPESQREHGFSPQEL
jgi:hypothetical protein